MLASEYLVFVIIHSLFIYSLWFVNGLIWAVRKGGPARITNVLKCKLGHSTGLSQNEEMEIAYFAQNANEKVPPPPP